jgi:hypothetical protein
MAEAPKAKKTQRFANAGFFRTYHPSNRPAVMGNERAFRIKTKNYGSPQEAYVLPTNNPVYLATRGQFSNKVMATENLPAKTLLKKEKIQAMVPIIQEAYPHEYARVVAEEPALTPDEVMHKAWSSATKKVIKSLRNNPAERAKYFVTNANAVALGAAAAAEAANILRMPADPIVAPQPNLVNWGAHGYGNVPPLSVEEFKNAAARAPQNEYANFNGAYGEANNENEEGEGENFGEEALAAVFGNNANGLSNRHRPVGAYNRSRNHGAFGGQRHKKRVQTLKKKLRRKGRGTRRRSRL